MLLILPFSSYAWSTSVVTSLNYFNNNFSNTNVESFDNDIPSAESIVFDSGVVSTLSERFTIAREPFLNFVTDGQFVSLLSHRGESASGSLTFNFSSPIIGFGGIFSDVDIIDIYINRTDSLPIFFDIEIENPDTIYSSGGFFGLVDLTEPFSSVTLTINNSTGSDYFRIDDLTYATKASTVPVPGAIWFIISGLYLLTRFSVRKKSPA
jgi:hypothetical protein